jgi:sulfur-oxidizing protein SoxZ
VAVAEGTMAAPPIRIRCRLANDVADVQILMPHPMETGLRVDEAGALVPAHYITDVAVTLAERSVFAARMSFAVSRDPLLAFRVRGAQAGQRLRVVWTDSHGDTRSDEAVIG